ncbi:hypothetical protein HDG34_003356 [Paraburkholderia sp. HC6.4b]|uniref:hypothetical protein n=1 Tax=unclassified Paraburkholderia TaxID=2615204 RepID=UPI0016134FA6|nr:MULTISPECIES: hypothetical protein [unclassified Paraburkholderia]MBB5409415.1 hypothetical protein [Paraburkholderia sp. HC6.4b]MBB5451144.1 hypothetical protein [Paraburkholderia sp. Kb1A]
MNINPTLSTIENILQYVTNPALGQPTNPDQVAVTEPQPYDPATLGFFLGTGLNLDGESSNTQIIVYLRPPLEDVAQDGVNQVLIYERQPLSDMAGVGETVAVNSQMSVTEMLQAIAGALDVVDDAIAFVTPPEGQPASVQVDAYQSPLYLPGAVTITLNWT